jgi:hypothetical protein
MRRTLLALILIGCSGPAFSQAGAGGLITTIRTGWNIDSFAIVIDGMIQNPANCPTADGYVSIHTLPGYSTYYTAALTAYSLREPVAITIDNTRCAQGRPMLIGINLGG